MIFRRMPRDILYRTARLFIAAVWLINGLYCKLLGGVPRHEAIVGRILGEEYSSELITIIGISEVLVAVWILTGIVPRICAIFQITLVLLMNVLEFWLIPDLLLWGRANFLFALLFVLVVYVTEFRLRTKTTGYA